MKNGNNIGRIRKPNKEMWLLLLVVLVMENHPHLLNQLVAQIHQNMSLYLKEVLQNHFIMVGTKTMLMHTTMILKPMARAIIKVMAITITITIMVTKAIIIMEEVEDIIIHITTTTAIITTGIKVTIITIITIIAIIMGETVQVTATDTNHGLILTTKGTSKTDTSSTASNNTMTEILVKIDK